MLYLSEADRQNLLLLARKAIVDAVTRRELPDSIPHEGIFAERRGVFVTLHVRGELRGCIGTTESGGRRRGSLRGKRGAARPAIPADAR
jgi:AMMECR1 domain-containing protein